ncbi:hypothetical protein J2125_004547 [Erwinia toletana]|uniref:Uncharacterized protein n=1 Tax=Winslowiella toletana TaxID=92490 RepID=A0ABS4PGV5_9GAMM|nr:hypothetical protein [Winslowiella toletana]MBP2171355.1 hypothetical protein [Winslowiella toletana]
MTETFFRGFLHGFVSLPVDFYYLGYDFIDTDKRWENQYDRERFIRLIKSGVASRQSLEKIVNVFMENFLNHVDFQKVKELSAKGGGSFLGRMTFNQLASANMGYVLSSRLVPRIASGLAIGSVLSAGAAISRSIYVSRDLNRRNPKIYDRLKQLGNLDLLYFMVEEKTRPFEQAVNLWSTDRNKFNQTCCYFFEKV